MQVATTIIETPMQDADATELHWLVLESLTALLFETE